MADTPAPRPPGPAPLLRNTTNAPLSQEHITSALQALSLKYTCNSDGDFSLRFSGEKFGGDMVVWVVVEGDNKDILKTFATNNRRIPKGKWYEALVLCNEYHKNFRYGRAYLEFPNPDDEQPEPILCFEAQITLRYGTTEGFVRTFITTSLEGARHVFTKASDENGLY